jgi:very-short-patch-repair endonuclease
MRRTLIITRARTLRKAMSEPEVMLWSRLRGRRSDRPTFRRQQPFGSLILDFYCSSARLAVEVDGRTHWQDEERERDEARDRWLERQGVMTMRIPASAIYRDLGGVVDGILLRVDELKASGRPLAPSTTRSSPGSSPGSAGGPPPAATRGR